MILKAALSNSFNKPLPPQYAPDYLQLGATRGGGGGNVG